MNIKLKIFYIIGAIIIVMLLGVGCNAYCKNNFPSFIYTESFFSSQNTYNLSRKDYTLDQGNPYSEIDTENGYDLIFHFNKKGEH